MTLPLTPEAIKEQVIALQTGYVGPESVLVSMIEQLGLNQRTAYMRYGPRMEPEGVPAHMNPDKGDREAGCGAPGNPAPLIVGTSPASGHESPASPPNHPLTPADPGWQPAIGCTVEELRKFGGLSDSWGLPKPMWAMVTNGGKDKYPSEPSKRLELLSKLTPAQRGELLAAVKR